MFVTRPRFDQPLVQTVDRDPAFAAGLAATIPQLRRYARRLARDAAGADDLVQDCLLRAWSRSHLFRPGTDLRAWLFAIMHNVHANQARRAFNREAPVSVDEMNESGPVSPPAQDMILEFRDFVAAFGELPAAKRKTMLLIGWDGKTYEEAAAALGVPAGTVRSRVSRAREMLRARLGSAAPGGRRRRMTLH